MSDWFKTDPVNGCLIGLDGCHYSNEHQAAHYSVIKLCGCGDPVSAFNFCRDALMLFDRRGVWDKPSSKEWVDAEDLLKKLIEERPEEAAHVFAHLLANLKLTEHGSSVGGSWLTKDGAKVVDLGPMTDEKLEDKS